MKKLLTAIGFTGLALVSGSAFAATKDCSAIQQKSGEAAYQKCLYDNQEDTFKQQIASYKAIIEKTKATVKASYEGKVNEENYTWKDIDLRLQMEETDRQFRIDQLGSNKENAEQVQIEKNLLSKLKKIHSLTTTVHGNKLKRLKLNMDAEIFELDRAVPAYELQLRQQEIPRIY